MQAYAEYLPDKMKMVKMCDVVCGCLHLLLQNSSYFCAIYPALDIPFPAIASRCNPRHVDTTFHYVTSQFSAFGRLGVARRFLALLAGLAGLAGLAVLAATTCSHPQLPAGAGGEAMG